MNTAVINIKTEPKVKQEAQKVAHELGFSLSSLINGYLRMLVKTKTVHFSLNAHSPTPYLSSSLSESAKNVQDGDLSPTFTTAEDAVNWLHSKE